MKKTIFTILIFIGIAILALFLIKIAGGNIIKDLTGQNIVQKADTDVSNGKLLGKKVPFFDLSSLGNTRIKLGDYTDKPFVVVFWVSWNVESANQLKILDEYISSTKNSNSLFSIVTINSQEEESVVKSFIRRGGYNVPIAVDSNGKATEDFNVKSLPTAFFVDRDGIIREIYSGVMNKDMFLSKIEQLLK